MTLWQVIFAAALIVSSLLIVFVVLLQEGRQAGLSGAIAGGAESFLGKSKGRTVGSKLAKWTRVIAILFFVLAFAGTLLLHFIK